jgi:hypothetical protein
VATELEPEHIDEIGFGGIALEYVSSAKIAGNRIEDIGLDVRTPSSGIYFREAIDGQIHDNLLRGIGRNERGENRNLPGVSGGIIVDQCWPHYSDPVSIPPRIRGKMGMASMTPNISRDRQGLAKELAAQWEEFRIPRSSALRVHNNVVSVNFGLSLDVRGSGSIHVTHNHLTSLAARINRRRARLGANVSVVNTEVPTLELVNFLIASSKHLQEHFLNSDYVPEELLKILQSTVYHISLTKNFDVIQFNDNHNYYENLSVPDHFLSLTAIVSSFEIQMDVKHTNERSLSHLISTHSIHPKGKKLTDLKGYIHAVTH